MSCFDPCSLYPELLLALNGFTGDIFVNDGDQSREMGSPANVTLVLSDDVPLDDTPIRDAFNSLAKLGFHCRCLQHFVTQHEGRHVGSSYRRALARGVAEVLDVYRQAVLRLQHVVMYDSTVTLSTIQHFLYDFEMVLPALHHVMYDIQHQKMGSSQILQLLYSKSLCGVPSLQSCFCRLLWHCNLVLYRHLTAWIAHGMLLDSEDEFFITRSTTLEPPSPTMGEEEEVDYSVHSMEWHNGFEVADARVPSYIPPPVAASILFTGKAVRILQHGGGVQQPRGLLADEDVLSFATQLAALRQQPRFDQLAFETCIADIRAKVAEELWRLAVVNADLPRHLQVLRDYFLMAKGDFFQCFLQEGKSLLALPPKPTTAEADIAIPFIQAASKVGADHDPLFQHVRLTFREQASVSIPNGAPTTTKPGGQGRVLTTHAVKLDGRTLCVPAFDQWDGLGLDYKLDWPLHLLLTPEVVAKYNVLFHYLMRLKRLQLALEDAWGTLRHLQAPDPAARRRMLKLWNLRHNMAHIMTNLQIYVQVDVIEGRYGLLIEAVQGAHDYGSAERAHREFVDALLLQSFLDLRQIMALLETMMSLCHRLCTMVQHMTGPTALGSVLDAGNEPKVDSIAAEFWRCTKMLYMALQSNKLQASHRAPYLRQFLLRLNFNGFMEMELQKHVGL